MDTRKMKSMDGNTAAAQADASPGEFPVFQTQINHEEGKKLAEYIFRQEGFVRFQDEKFEIHGGRAQNKNKQNVKQRIFLLFCKH